MDLRGNKDYSTRRKKSIYSVQGKDGNRIGTACAVRKNGEFRLLTWCKPGLESAKAITVDRYCSKHPQHQHKYTVKTPLEKENGMTFMQLESEPEHFLEMTKVPANQGNISAYTFDGRKRRKLKFKKSKEGVGYELKMKKPKQKKVADFAIGAPIILEGQETRERVVVGIVDENLSPVFFSETDFGKYYRNCKRWYMDRSVG